MNESTTFDYLVIGDPVAHSRSPQMQNAAFEYYGMGSPYGKLRVDPARIGEFVAFARENLKGVNLTVPHKQVVLPFVDELSPQAAVCESVNTLKIENGKVFGFSTDGAGISGAIKENFGLALKDLHVVMLGAGGAATAIAFELGWSGTASLTIANRSVDKAVALTEKIKKHAPGVQLDAIALTDRKKLGAAIEKADLLLQVTSLGLHAEDPAPMDLELLKLNPHLRIFDAIYHPTPILKYGAELGLQVADGREMLIWQGAASFEIWTGKKAPVEIMREGFKKNC
ncbi:MAG: shikimate dehydrogenase [Lentisphaeria bacterium]|nr:shikimate dehydrogenase [Lentisphaeria bacterium]